MKKKVLYLVVLLCSSLLMLSCSKDEEKTTSDYLNGTWTSKFPVGDAIETDQLTFDKASGTYVYAVKIEYTDASMVANNSTETMTGTYSVNDKIITLNRSNGDNVQATILSVNETTLVLTYDPNNPNIALTYVK